MLTSETFEARASGVKRVGVYRRPVRGLLAFALVATCLSGRAFAADRPASSLADVTCETTIYVEDRAGHHATGAFVRATDRELVISTSGAERAFAADDVQRIWRRGDSVSNGFWIGAGVGIVLGSIATAMADNATPAARVAGTAAAAATYGLIGAGIDALHVGRTLIYERPRSGVRPRPRIGARATPRSAAVSLSLSFWCLAESVLILLPVTISAEVAGFPDFVGHSVRRPRRALGWSSAGSAGSSMTGIMARRAPGQ